MPSQFLEKSKGIFRSMFGGPSLNITVFALTVLTIGINSVLFGILDSGVLKATPFREVNNLFGITCKTDSFPRGGSCSIPVAVELREEASGIEELAFYGKDFGVLQHEDRKEGVVYEHVSSSFFSTLGVWPSHGR